VDGVELLPFKKICRVKYEQMGIAFPFADVPTPTKEQMTDLNQYV
jgi:pyruvate formate lyase activating enzyme